MKKWEILLMTCHEFQITQQKSLGKEYRRLSQIKECVEQDKEYLR